MATVSMESLWNFLNSISLSRQNKLWLAKHLMDDTEGATKVGYDELGIPSPVTSQEALKLINEIEEENGMLGEISAEDGMKDTRDLIDSYGH